MEKLSPSLQAIFDLVQRETILNNETLAQIGFNPNSIIKETNRLRVLISLLNQHLPPEEQLTLVARGSSPDKEFPVYMRVRDTATPPSELSKK